MKHRLFLLFFIAVPVLFLGWGSLPLRALAARSAQDLPATPTPEVSPAPGHLVTSGVLVQAVQEAVAARQDVPAFAINQIQVDHIDYSEDGRMALISLEALDPQTGQPEGREPGLAVASLKPEVAASGDAGAKAVPSAWEITFQSDPAWQAQFDSLPQELKPQEYQMAELAAPTQAQAVTGITLGGYLLPWAGGQAKTLTWSVKHASCAGEDCRYAFDWWDGTHFPLLAAKGGTVFGAVWNWPNDDHTPGHTNYLVLMDASTTPVSYQIYYHMEQNSIPAALRVKGAQVTQGQFIGRVDNTGASTGSHLHFMVHTNSYGLWGQSVDITFRDVRVNWDGATQGGRPRMCSETVSLPQYGTQCQPGNQYVSGNYGSAGPDGGLSAPAEGSMVATPNVHVEGWGTDDLGITKMQVMAKGFGEWVDVGAAQTSNPFAADINLCNYNIPDGPVTLALKLWDVEGNPATGSQGMRTVLKQARCPATPPPPPCTPGASQVALYSEPGFGGACELYGPGSYPDAVSLDSLGDNQAASIQVGSSASATLFQDAAFQGRAETFIASDRNLADNQIGSLTASSLQVTTRGAAASAPVLLIPSNLTSDDSIIVGWQDTGGAYDFLPELFSSSNLSSSIWARPFDHLYFKVLDALQPGSYTLRVCVSPNNESPTTYWTCPAGWKSASAQFTVTQGSPSSAQASFPLAASFDGSAENWQAGSGWGLGPGYNSTQGFVFNQGGACQDGQRCRGALTSPGVRMPAAGDSYVHFGSYYTGLEAGSFADIRKVQISSSADNGATYSGFSDLYTFASSVQDTPGAWLTSPDGIVVSCSKYCGKLVRLRFLFDSIDGQGNSGLSWAVDNVRIDQNGAASAWNQPVVALPLNTPKAGTLSQSGNIDWYSFTAAQGNVYQADLTASAIPARLELLDSDKTSLLAAGRAADVSPQRLSFRAPAAGTYYLRVFADPYPGGGPGSTYTINLKTLSDTTPPVAILDGLGSNGYLNEAPGSLRINGVDIPGGSGLSRVDYYYHLADWASGRWWKIGTGVSQTPGDGWPVVFDPASIPETYGVAILARAVDWAQNVTDTAAWNVVVDRTAPSSVMGSFQLAIPNTAVQLSWYGTDNFSGVDHYDLEVTDDQGSQSVIQLPGSSTSYWFVGAYGRTYTFRMRAVDRAWNAEAYASSPEASVTMNNPGSGNDPYEGADTPSSATALTPDGAAIQRTFYNQGSQTDVDWVSFQAKAGQRYFIWALPPSGSPAAAQITLYPSVTAAKAGSAAAALAAPDLGKTVLMAWTAPQAGTVVIQLRSVNPSVQGSGVAYQVRVITHYSMFLPSIRR